MRVSAAIVTYNRLPLLKECIHAVLNQSMEVESVIVIDNASTDGTREFLSGLNHPKVHTTFHDKNMGGAAGFAEGIAIATRQGSDAVWIMDDDTVPHQDTLQRLAEAIDGKSDVGFVCSKVVWTDGVVHMMNRPGFVSSADENESIRQIRSASFVSLLVPCRIIREVGLPYKEFYIWVDDAEFTSRIFKAGHKGLLVNNSVAEHKTDTNYGATISTATQGSAWKFYYHMRNGMFASRDEDIWIVWFFKYLNHLWQDLRRTRHLPKETRSVLRKNLWRGFVDGLTFRPDKSFV